MARQIAQKKVIQRSQIKSSKTIDTNEGEGQTHMLIFHIKENKAILLKKNINREIICHLHEIIQVQVTYNDTLNVNLALICY